MKEETLEKLQDRTIREFLKLLGKKTLREYSDLTGIEKTRIFRLINGAEMKITEFEIFQTIILKQKGEVINWQNIISKVELNKACEKNSYKCEASILIERNERLQRYLNQAKVA